MSAIARFIKVPTKTLQRLTETYLSPGHAGPEPFEAWIRENGSEVASYKWSGYVLAVLLPYLDTEHQINLMKSEWDELAALLTKSRRATHFIFTASHRTRFLNSLDPAFFSKDEMRDYFNDFNGTKEGGIGDAMLDGVIAFREAIQSLDDDSVVIFAIS